jgi:hypothetical protein
MASDMNLNLTHPVINYVGSWARLTTMTIQSPSMPKSNLIHVDQSWQQRNACISRKAQGEIVHEYN